MRMWLTGNQPPAGRARSTRGRRFLRCQENKPGKGRLKSQQTHPRVQDNKFYFFPYCTFFSFFWWKPMWLGHADRCDRHQRPAGFKTMLLRLAVRCSRKGQKSGWKGPEVVTVCRRLMLHFRRVHMQAMGKQFVFQSVARWLFVTFINLSTDLSKPVSAWD